jgi:hypothetical protein
MLGDHDEIKGWAETEEAKISDVSWPGFSFFALR